MKKYDLIIAGAGLAGLALARELNDSGLRILMLEKRPAKKLIKYHSSGTFMEPEEFGLPRSVFYKLEKIRYCSKNNEVIRPVKAAYVIDREGLYAFLIKEALKNRDFTIIYKAEITSINRLPGQEITGIEYRHKGRNRAVSGLIYADCTGLAAKLGTCTGLTPKHSVMAAGVEFLNRIKKDTAVAQFFVGSNIAGSYGWIFPKGGGRVISGIGTIRKSQYGKLNRLYDVMKSHWRLKTETGTRMLEKHVSTLRTGKPLKALVSNNLLILGDSALQANPLIGEGIRFVLFAAKCAAEAVVTSVKTNDISHLKSYENKWVLKNYKSFKTAFMMQKVLKWATGYDWILDKGVQVLKVISENDFRRVISADISAWFFIRIFFEAVWKIKILGRKY